MAAARPFGPVHGHIGRVEDVLGCVTAMPGEGGPDAGADVDVGDRGNERPGQSGIEAGDDGGGIGQAGQILAQDDELVT